MTKKEFAARLLFWVLPWPISRALPRSLRIYYFGPAGSPPSGWYNYWGEPYPDPIDPDNPPPPGKWPEAPDGPKNPSDPYTPGPGPVGPKPGIEEPIGWYDYTSDAYWDDVECEQVEYVAGHWEIQEIEIESYFYRRHTWQADFRPTKIRITFDCKFYEIYLQDADNGTIAEIPSEPGEHEVDMEWQDNDLMRFYFIARTLGNITKIEFYGEHVS